MNNLHVVSSLMSQMRSRIAPAPAPAPSPSPSTGGITTFEIQAAATGTLAFSLGHAFRKGDVASGQALVLDTTTHQVTPISSWDDGSVKHALIAGTAALTNGVALTVTISRGTAPGGTALAEADLIAASPSASVSYGAYGTVSLADLLGTAALFQTERAGPQYAEFQYIANFPSDSSVRAVFFVQLWSNDAYRVRVAVENGTALATSASKTGTAVVSIAGLERYNATVAMSAGTRWDIVASSATEPAATHNTQYLRATKLVPNFGYTAPSTTALNALSQTYTPMNGMSWATDQGAPGFDAGIGLLTHWDAMYCVSGDSRARASVIAHGRAYGIYGIFYRDSTTKRMPAFSDYSTAYSDSEDLVSGSYRWEFAHHPNAGYLPWLMTGERFFLEVMHANAWACFYTQNPNGGGVSRLYTSQTRGRGWRFRTMAAVAAVSPTSDPIAADCRTNLGANLANWKSVHVDADFPGTGLVGIYDDKEVDAGFQHSIFENLFLTSTLGWTWDIEPGLSTTPKANHLAVRDFAYRVPVGLTGRGQTTYSEFSWRRAPGPYRMNIGSTSSTANLYNTWNEVYDATYGDALDSTAGLAILESYADDASAEAFPQGNWGHVITALSYAVDHGATDAQAGMDRVLGASNWATNAAKFNDWPQYGVLPRAPAWYAAQTAGTWKNLGTSFMDGPGPFTTLTGDAASCSEITSVGPFSYSGGFVNNASFYDRNGVRRYGGAIGIFGGGHNAYGGNEVVLFRLQDQTWYRVRDAFGSPTYSTSENSDGTPNSRHTYQSILWVPHTNELFSAITGARLSTDGSSTDYSHSFDFTDAAPNGTAPGPWTRETDFPYPTAIFTMERTGLAATYDSDNKRVVCVTPGRYRVTYFDVQTRAWSTESEAAGSPISYSDRIVSVHIPVKNWLVCHTPPEGGAEGGLLACDLDDATPNLVTVTEAGSTPASSGTYGITWDALNERIVLCTKAGVLYFCTPPATIGGTWTWTTSTPGGDTPDAQTWSGEGIWGRFGYVDDGVVRGYVLCAGPDTRPCFYKIG
jgi:hypothetical protein